MNDTTYTHRDGSPVTTPVFAEAKDSASTTIRRTCTKCGGSGDYHYYLYNAVAACFPCQGTGRLAPKTVKVYTAEKLAKLNAAAEKREAKAIAKANEEAAKVAQQRKNTAALNMMMHGTVIEQAQTVAGKSSFVDDVVAKAISGDPISERQAEALEEAVGRLLAQKAADEAAIDCPNGRTEITGTILSAKTRWTQYGDQYKMLVRDDRGFKVWGTVPRSINGALEDLPGCRVTLTATIQRSDDDRKFGFYSRPAKASTL